MRTATAERSETREFLVSVVRAFGGAIVFSLPIMMTMEMWWLGFMMDRLRLALLIGVMIPVLVGLSRFGGFKQTAGWREDVADAAIAYSVAAVAAALALLLLAVLRPGMPVHEIVGKIALQAVPGAFGAMLARSQLGGENEAGDGGEGDNEAGNGGRYGTEVFLMGAGALFLAFNVAPTEEMILIAYQMTPWHALALLATSLALMHAFVYAAEFQGGHEVPEGTPGWSVFLRFTVVGYAVALLVSAYVLWTFGRFEDDAAGTHVFMTVVLGFPAAVGAAAARLIL